jgi:SAM-dependent methyltransferase
MNAAPRRATIHDMSWEREDLARNYDQVAAAYTARFAGELDHKPFDRQKLDELADALRGRGPVCDLGCGPGHVARYLAERGVDVFGIDLSPGMVAEARRLAPGLRFEVGDMLAMNLADGSLAGVVAMHSMIHLPRAEVPRAAAEICRVLRPGGLVWISVHGGDGELHADEFLGVQASFDASLFQPEELADLLRGAGLRVDQVAARPPYQQEFPTTRIYVRAVRP